MKLAKTLCALAIVAFATMPLTSLASQPLNMAVSFSPNPPEQGTETITVQIGDATHKPVNGGNVTISTAMPSMSMTGPSVQAIAKGNGRYVATIKLAFATRWSFTILAKVGGKTLKRTIASDIQ